MHPLELLLVGLTIGALARLLIPGRQPGTWGTSILLGVAGSFVGAFGGRLFGYGEGQPPAVVMSVGGAVALLVGYRLIVVRRASA